MAGLDDDGDALWVQFLLQGLGDLHRQAFLYLQAPAEHLHKPGDLAESHHTVVGDIGDVALPVEGDRKSTRLNSSHSQISYAVFCLKKKKKKKELKQWANRLTACT